MNALGEVKEYMTDNAIITFTNESILHVMEVMSNANFRHVPVMNDQMRLFRIFTDSDIIRMLAANPTIESILQPIGQLSSQLIVTISPETPIEKAITTMANARISSLPVMEDGRITGILTIRDIVHQDRLWNDIPNIYVNPYSFPTGHSLTDNIVITPEFSLWQILDRFNHNDSIRNLLVFNKYQKLIGMVNSLILFFEIIQFRKKLINMSYDNSFQEYLFTTTLEDVLIPQPLTLIAPVKLHELRDTMCTNQATAVIIGDRFVTHSVITERDLFYYLESHIASSRKTRGYRTIPVARL